MWVKGGKYQPHIHLVVFTTSVSGTKTAFVIIQKRVSGLVMRELAELKKEWKWLNDFMNLNRILIEHNI